MYLRPSVAYWLWLLMISTGGSIGLCQEDRRDATKRILVKMFEERAKLVQFACDIRVTQDSSLITILAPSPNLEHRYKVRFSSIDQYWLQVMETSVVKSTQPIGVIQGYIGAEKIFGEFRPQVPTFIRLYGEDSKIDELKKAKPAWDSYFDFRTIGLGTFDDHRRKRRLEDIESNMLALARLGHIPRNDGIVRIKWDDIHVLDIDTHRGYWPVYAKTQFMNGKGPKLEHEWRMELEDRNEFWVPKKATLFNGQLTATLEFTWHAVNEPILVGKEGIRAIADEYGVTFDDRTVEVRN